MHEGNVESQCIADYASYDTGFVETAGVAAARACPVVGVPAPEDFAGAAAKVGEYRSEFGQDPGTWSPYTYDSLNFLAHGVEKAGGTGSKKLTGALDAVKGWKGWTGSVTIDPRNGNRRPATVVIVDTDAKGKPPRRRGLGEGGRRALLARRAYHPRRHARDRRARRSTEIDPPACAGRSDQNLPNREERP